MAIEKYNFQRFSAARIFIITFLVSGYLALSWLLIGFKPDQLILASLFCFLYFGNHLTRKLILGFSIFIIYWIIFDYMKTFPNYKFNTVHIEDLYYWEKNSFGIKSGSLLLTPNEFWNLHSGKLLDLLSGFFYLCWVPVPLTFAAYLFFKNKQQFLNFSLTFFLINLLGFVVYYSFPAAPPWYFQKFGSSFYPLTPGNPAGLARFDLILNTKIFESIYSKSSNVFAAMPSLHASYPLLVLYYGLRNKMGLLNIFFAVITVGIWFTAVYTGHHYVLDVLAGILCCIFGTFLFNWIIKMSVPRRLIGGYYKIIGGI
jgi:inositol phosphorylceramide synthase catalytic subunit